MNKRVTAISAAYTALLRDDVIQADMSGGAYTVTLPTVGLLKQKRFEIKDTGSAGTNNITVSGEGSELIDGSASYLISTDKASVAFTPNQARTAWNVS